MLQREKTPGIAWWLSQLTQLKLEYLLTGIGVLGFLLLLKGVVKITRKKITVKNEDINNCQISYQIQ